MFRINGNGNNGNSLTVGFTLSADEDLFNFLLRLRIASTGTSILMTKNKLFRYNFLQLLLYPGLFHCNAQIQSPPYSLTLRHES